MEHIRIIDKIKQIRADNEYTKPRYKIKNLYVGEIVLLENNNCTRVKRFAIFYKDKNNNFIHIKSNQYVKLIDNANNGDYAIKDILHFTYSFIIPIQRNNQTINSKMSRSFIDTLETQSNKKLAPKQKETELFGL